MCTTTGQVSVTIDSEWSEPHDEKHFYVRMLPSDGKKNVRKPKRRFDVGQEKQTWDIGGCRGFKLLVEIINPKSSPSLKGKVRVSG